MIFNPHPYQQHSIQHIIDNPAAGLFLDMGLGKTASTLTAIDVLKYDRFEVRKVLVVAPKRVAETVWDAEIGKWDHLRHLTTSKILGSEKDRKTALKREADIYIINRENIVWLIAHFGQNWPFDMLVIDELSSFKSAKAARFKALKQIRPKIARVVGLTGTPMPNGLLDLWPQMYLLDMGHRLGKTIGGYRDEYFTPGKRNGQVIYSYDVRGKKEDPLIGTDIYEKIIFDKISDICISMKSEDYLDLPERVDNDVLIHLSPKVLKMYEDFEEAAVMELLNEDAVITAANAASLTGKLLQFAGGAMYREDKTFYEIHAEKLEMLEEMIEAANGVPVFVTYWFKHEKDRILEHLKAYKPQELTDAKSVALWNSGKASVMLGHPMSMGHGLNMQEGGDYMMHYAQHFSCEVYQQVIKRIHRQGRIKPVFNSRLVVAGTIDEYAVEVQERKIKGQDALMYATKAIIDKYR